MDNLCLNRPKTRCSAKHSSNSNNILIPSLEELVESFTIQRLDMRTGRSCKKKAGIVNWITLSRKLPCIETNSPPF